MVICASVQAMRRVAPRDHVLDEHHVEVAGAPDDDFLVIPERKLASLVLPGDEPDSELASARSWSYLGSLVVHRGASHYDVAPDGARKRRESLDSSNLFGQAVRLFAARPGNIMTRRLALFPRFGATAS